MAHLIYTERALTDLERLTDFLLQTELVTAIDTIGLITEAIQVLENHPFIGRTVGKNLRELIISRGKTGYLALYSLERHEQVALILSIRHQRETGYAEQ